MKIKKILNNKPYIFVIVFLTFLILIISIYLINTKPNKRLSESSKSVSVIINNEDTEIDKIKKKISTLPALVNNSSWGELKRDSQKYYTESGKSIIINGYLRQLEYEDSKSKEPWIDLVNYSQDNFFTIVPTDWEQDNYQIADGVTGAQRGYKKDFDNKRIVIIYSYQAKYAEFIPWEDKITCPCKYIISIFISDPFIFSGS